MAQIQFTHGLENNIYTLAPAVVDLDVTEQQLVSDYGDPIVTLGGLIDVVGTTEQLAVTGITGTFTVGETITGATSLATAKVFYVNTTLSIIYITNRVGNFGPANVDIVSGNASTATATVVSQDPAISKFEARYGVAPLSPANFSLATLTRRIPSTLNGVVYSFNGNLNLNAENNAKDFEVVCRVLIEEKWAALKANMNDWELPPNPSYWPLP